MGVCDDNVFHIESIHLLLLNVRRNEAFGLSSNFVLNICFILKRIAQLFGKYDAKCEATAAADKLAFHR